MQLLGLIGETGSISAAGRAIGMSYRHAWKRVDSLNTSFAALLVAARPSGTGGTGGTGTGTGGGVLPLPLPLGAEIVRLYRALEQGAASAGAAELARLKAVLAALPP